MALKARSGRIPATEPNWSDSVGATFAFKTSIIEKKNGSEQRAAMRETARLQLSWKSLLKEDAYHRHMADFAGTGQDQLFVVSNPWRRALTTGITGADTIPISPMPFWAVAGARIVVSDSSNQEVATILSVAGTTITLSANLFWSFAAGSVVRPAYDARAAVSAAFTAPTATVWEGQVQYDVDPASDPQAAATITPDTFESRDVFLTKPNWAQDVTAEWNSARRTFDPGRGSTYVDSPRGFPVRVQKMQYTQMSQTSAEELLAFWLKQKGQRGSFFMPTWTVDLRALTTAAAASSTLTVEGTDFYDAYNGSLVFNMVYRTYADGTYQINRIASMAVVGSDTELTMTDPWDQDVTAGDYLSWCHRWRFASDIFQMAWQTSEAMQVSLPVMTLRNEAP